MAAVDYAVMIVYGLGLLGIGLLFSTRIKDSAEMFAAGGRSPWWVSGLSGFMTIFSAGTFVVWGGIAYRLGAVAITILVCSGGISTLLVGYYLAGRWRALGVTSAAQYVDLRFGKAIVQFYVWLNLTFKLITIGVALYALGVLLAALTPLPEGSALRDAETGHLSVAWAVTICGLIVVIYTVAGGLWAVLMTDVVQFVLLSLSVSIVVPLCLMKVGGFGAFVTKVPQGFLRPAAGEYTYPFLVMWVIINFFRHGGEWAYVQRFLCVPSQKDAKKVAYLMGMVFILSPFLWMLPPMLYRVMNAQADPEQAYILACQAVLPPGMMGMMLAAMFSATASMASSELNVYAGVLTHDVYRRFVRPRASEAHLVMVGRIVTALIGVLFIAVALAIPVLGGAEKVVITLVTLVAGPMVTPTVWGLFSRRISQSAVWLTVAVGFICGAILKVGFTSHGWLADIGLLRGTATWLQAHKHLSESIAGILVPLLVLLLMEWRASGTAEGWQQTMNLNSREQEPAPMTASTLPAKIVMWTMVFLGSVMAILAVMSTEQKAVLAVFAAMLLLIGGGLRCFCCVQGRGKSG